MVHLLFTTPYCYISPAAGAEILQNRCIAYRTTSLFLFSGVAIPVTRDAFIIFYNAFFNRYDCCFHSRILMMQNTVIVMDTDGGNRYIIPYCHFTKLITVMSAKKTFTTAEGKEIGEKLGVGWDKFSVEEFTAGMNVELEHGQRDPGTNVTNDDPLMTGKIALAHLNEFPDYYERLEKMETEAEEFWDKQSGKE
ncbi:hypothetical protein L1S32_03630 [Methanogenium sp. S4BF]|uniref:DUF5661 family protein n=1 Tax=Methanogenium sp. S4BF TaxID=1789226 RepID=UPI002417FF4E|nr:DUF5661 family protein [Methanogenium sp. S4BF]WFN35222.1 hypothetical protein L1S32_03630 [Methanogenium sp. S4BF]